MPAAGDVLDRATGKALSDWSNGELRALLDWYQAIGVRSVVSDTPSNWLAVPEPAAASPEPFQPTDPHSSPANRFSPMTAAPTVENEHAARVAAAGARTMDELQEALSQFEGCNLRYTATNLVFADGNAAARVMLVGEAPGREEDLQGLPFVGRSGRLLDRMLAAIGLSRETVYIANIVPWRPPGNRTPTPQETAACRPFVERQIALCDPDFLICLGNAASRELLSTSEGILRLRGRWREFDAGSRTIKAMAMLHPAYLLRQPLHKRLAWRDLLELKHAITEATDGGAGSETGPPNPNGETTQ